MEVLYATFQDRRKDVARLAQFSHLLVLHPRKVSLFRSREEADSTFPPIEPQEVFERSPMRYSRLAKFARALDEKITIEEALSRCFSPNEIRILRDSEITLAEGTDRAQILKELRDEFPHPLEGKIVKFFCSRLWSRAGGDFPQGNEPFYLLGEVVGVEFSLRDPWHDEGTVTVRFCDPIDGKVKVSGGHFFWAIEYSRALVQ